MKKYDFAEAEALKQKVSDAVKDILEFNSKTMPRMKEGAKWRIHTALVDCNAFISHFSPQSPEN